MVTAIGDEGKEILPAPSVAVVVKVWVPSANGEVGVMLQDPLALTMAVPIGVVPS
jgi:hypothetical protein